MGWRLSTWSDVQRNRDAKTPESWLNHEYIGLKKVRVGFPSTYPFFSSRGGQTGMRLTRGAMSTLPKIRWGSNLAHLVLTRGNRHFSHPRRVRELCALSYALLTRALTGSLAGWLVGRSLSFTISASPPVCFKQRLLTLASELHNLSAVMPNMRKSNISVHDPLRTKTGKWATLFYNSRVPSSSFSLPLFRCSRQQPPAAAATRDGGSEWVSEERRREERSAHWHTDGRKRETTDRPTEQPPHEIGNSRRGKKLPRPWPIIPAARTRRSITRTWEQISKWTGDWGSLMLLISNINFSWSLVHLILLWSLQTNPLCQEVTKYRGRIAVLFFLTCA